MGAKKYIIRCICNHLLNHHSICIVNHHSTCIVKCCICFLSQIIVIIIIPTPPRPPPLFRGCTSHGVIEAGMAVQGEWGIVGVRTTSHHWLMAPWRERTLKLRGVFSTGFTTSKTRVYRFPTKWSGVNQHRWRSTRVALWGSGADE